jgi:D-alanyl-lipoteichoic acid acyltransferase DltB (MBOAT superfamily)
MILGYFKYLFFIEENITSLLSLVDINVEVNFIKYILPLGISFYTFEAISYIIDVYRGKNKPFHNYFIYGAFILFFPKLIAGPIVRANQLIPQFLCVDKFKFNNILSGFRRIVNGLFLKVVLADNIAPLVDAGFAVNASLMSSWDVLTLSFLFGFQIYFDFAGYSSIAIGSAMLMGIKLPENFNFPYLASSPRDFWSRWHISLSSWIRDYIYFPLKQLKFNGSTLGVNKHDGLNMHSINALFITWFLMGLWHGSSWNFVFWGIYHAILILLFRLIFFFEYALVTKFQLFIGWTLTFPLVMLSWILFRASDLHTAIDMYSRLFSYEAYTYLGLRENTYIVTLALTILIILNGLSNNFYKLHKNDLKNFILIGNLLAGFIIFYLVFVFLRPINQYIYFQF